VSTEAIQEAAAEEVKAPESTGPVNGELQRLMQQPIHRPSAVEIVAQTPQIERLAAMMHRSGLAPADLQRQGQDAIEVIMIAGLELGIPPVQAVRVLHLIRGRIGMAAQVILGLFMARCPGGKVKLLESTDERCTIWAYRPGQDPMQETFEIAEAQRAGLVKQDGGYGKWPKDMCFARAVSRLGRRYWPDVLMGYGYTPEELDAADLPEPAEVPAISPDAPQAATRAERQKAPTAAPTVDPAQTRIKDLGIAWQAVFPRRDQETDDGYKARFLAWVGENMGPGYSATNSADYTVEMVTSLRATLDAIAAEDGAEEQG